MADLMTLLWGAGEAPKRGPRPTLTLDAIAGAGIGIADADGLAAVTMQRVADALGVTKMALYRYVPGKDELVALMVDRGIGAPPRHEADDWRACLTEWALHLFGRFHRHPWALGATVGARVLGPHELDWMEQAVAALDGTGLGGGERLDVAATLAGHVRGIAQQAAAVPDGPEAAMATGIGAILRGRETRFPALTAAFGSAAEEGTGDNALEFGLARILDGVELLLAGRG
ncbi:TetR/AcrR family transcriptional regulator [Amycolatopsis minnesotensis]|uniref:TetR/AcrR family transcriptional regulator n=1 Tax=Amycolatopsis minnesotensis TaxID=337894 RepID=A0ABN2R585_9PSEU